VKSIVVPVRVIPPKGHTPIFSTPAGDAFVGIDRTNTAKMAIVNKLKRFMSSLLWAMRLPHFSSALVNGNT
jgi:hypothetical protein